MYDFWGPNGSAPLSTTQAEAPIIYMVYMPQPGIHEAPLSPDSEFDASNREEQPVLCPNGEVKAKKPLSFYLAFLGLNICVLLVSMDSTVLSVSLPIIAQELNSTAIESFWAGLCFLLAVVVSMPIITSLSDVLGRKPPLYASFILFLVGSIVFAVANNMGVLILGRTLQGLGGGGLDVLSEVVLADITTLKERGLYLGLFSVPMAGGSICGPLIGAALAEKASWRWIGWINLPLGAVGLVLSVFFLRLKTLEAGFVSKLARLDWEGMGLYLAGSTLFSLPLSWAGSLHPWSSYETLLPLIIGVVVLVLFGLYERYPGQPIFPYRIFASQTAFATLIGAFLHGAVFNGGLLYLLLFFQAIFLDTPFRSAVQVLPICVFVVVFSLVGGVVVEVTRKYKLLLMASWPCLAIGMRLFALWRPGSSDGLKYGPQVLAGVGLGVIFLALTFPMNASQKTDDAGLAVGIMVSCRMFGGMTGLAIGSTVFNSVFEQRIQEVAELGGDLVTLRDASTAIAFIPSLRENDSATAGYDAVIDAYRVSLMAVFLVLAGMGVLGTLTSLFTKELSLEIDEIGRQGLVGAEARK